VCALHVYDGLTAVKRAYFQSLEGRYHAVTISLPELIENLGYDNNGLVPVVTQDTRSKKILMLAWMNADALHQTIATGLMTYWSRSRNSLWVKGETSGNVQKLVSMSVDCDGDAVLCKVKQSGPACHTDRPDCFYIDVKPKSNEAIVQGRLFRK
jgi:phosphoribosyl-AMP cyclohydrolase